MSVGHLRWMVGRWKKHVWVSFLRRALCRLGRDQFPLENWTPCLLYAYRYLTLTWEEWLWEIKEHRSFIFLCFSAILAGSPMLGTQRRAQGMDIPYPALWLQEITVMEGHTQIGNEFFSTQPILVSQFWKLPGTEEALLSFYLFCHNFRRSKGSGDM